jgi:hypothetical protein
MWEFFAPVPLDCWHNYTVSKKNLLFPLASPCSRMMTYRNEPLAFFLCSFLQCYFNRNLRFYSSFLLIFFNNSSNFLKFLQLSTNFYCYQWKFALEKCFQLILRSSLSRNFNRTNTRNQKRKQTLIPVEKRKKINNKDEAWNFPVCWCGRWEATGKNRWKSQWSGVWSVIKQYAISRLVINRESLRRDWFMRDDLID